MVSFAQYLKLIEPQGVEDVLSLFLEIPKEELLKKRIIGLEAILTALNFIKTEPLNIPDQPTQLGKFKLPKDITVETVEQYQALQDEIKKSVEATGIVEKTKFLANFAAIYCQALEEDFDYDKAMALAQTFGDYPCEEVIAAGTFFLFKVIGIEKNLTPDYLHSITRMKNSWPVSKTSTRRSVSTPRSTRSRDMSGRKTKKSKGGR
jgi:hypothetical protein